MKNKILGLATVVMIAGTAVSAAEEFLILDGEPKAQIIIGEDPPRMAGLAAEELQIHLEKISGARLPIGMEPDDAYPLKIYVGQSPHTEALGITSEGLEFGAFKMVSGPDYLVLLGDDFDYQPMEVSLEEWDELTGSTWRNPLAEGRGQNQETGIWTYDEGGSLYAVYEFLRSLGVRWYMPGDLGVVIPEMASIPLPELNETVHPDYPLRFWIWAGARYANFDRDAILFERRVGAGTRYEILGNTALTHGLRNVHGREEMQQAHPEYYALIGGERDIYSHGTGHACLSSDGLVEEAANYARAVFDHLDAPLVQLSPQDGFRQCECEGCAGMSPSDNVFTFLDRVARKVYETHPDRIILGAAYTSYREPPEAIESFSPNFAISINNMGRPRFNDPEYWDNYMDLINRWSAKLAPNRIIRVENTRYGVAPIPVIHPRGIAKDLQALQGLSLGERNELRNDRDLPGATHLNQYVMGRYYWDADQDIEELLDEYYELFYGPAADEMKEAFDFAEANTLVRGGTGERLNWFERRKQSLATEIEFWERVAAARETAGDTVFGERIDVLLSEATRSVEEARARLAQMEEEGDPRANAPAIVATDSESGTDPAVYELVDGRTGEAPEYETTFTVMWEEGELIFDVVCQEPDMENLFVANNVWSGDTVAILLETPFHAHYHIEINPDGAMFDRIVNADEGERWSSEALVESERGDDYWRLRVRIPVADEAAGEGDPNHFVVGEKPTAGVPWYFNVGRARVRGQEKEVYLFSPVGEGSFHQPEKFGILTVE